MTDINDITNYIFVSDNPCKADFCFENLKEIFVVI